MAELVMGLIWMVAEFYLCSFFLCEYGRIGIEEGKKNQGFFQVAGVYWWVVLLGLGWWWVDEKEGKTERWRTEMKREEREIFYIILLCNLYYFNMQYEKIKYELLDVL